MREKRGLPVRDMVLADLPTTLGLLRHALADRELPYPTLDLGRFELDLTMALAAAELKALVAVTKRESYKVKGILMGRIHPSEFGTPNYRARIEVVAVDPVFRDRTPSVAGRLVDQFWTWAQIALAARGEAQAVLEIAHSPGGYQAEVVEALGAVAYEIRSVVATQPTTVVAANGEDHADTPTHH